MAWGALIRFPQALLGYYDDEDAVADAARKASFSIIRNTPRTAGRPHAQLERRSLQRTRLGIHQFMQGRCFRSFRAYYSRSVQSEMQQRARTRL